MLVKVDKMWRGERGLFWGSYDCIVQNYFSLTEFLCLTQNYLTDEALAAVKALLPDSAEGELAAVCAWADQVRWHYHWSSALHYVDTPDFRCNYDYCSKLIFFHSLLSSAFSLILLIFSFFLYLLDCSQMKKLVLYTISQSIYGISFWFNFYLYYDFVYSHWTLCYYVCYLINNYLAEGWF